MNSNKQRRTGRAVKAYTFIASDSTAHKFKNFKVIFHASLSDLVIFRFRDRYKKKYGI